MDDRIFREYDIRGIIDVNLDVDIAYSIGKAYGTLLKTKNPNAKTVSVGRDGRISSETLSNSLTNGIISTGINVINIGLCPTPLQYFSLHHLNIDGGIMVTGSHNPPEYNGFKLSIGKETIFGDDIQKIKDIINTKNFLKSDKEGTITSYNIIKAYKDFILERFSYLSDYKYKRFKVVLDSGNGTAGLVAPSLLESIGCDVISLYQEPDGRFPNHHPDPTVIEYIKDLIKTTIEANADIGVGYDGDADRIGIVDNTGRIIWGDQIMIILSREILKRRPGSVIIGDVKCSQLMFEDIEKNGGKPIMWKTGHSLIKDKMNKEKAVLAGEFSGHIFIADNYFGYDDAIYTTIRLIEIMKLKGLNIEDLISDVPKMYYTPEIRLECPEEKKKIVVEKLVNLFKNYSLSSNSPIKIKSINDIDGIRVVFENGWGLVRSSNTQPVIVLRFEAKDEKSLEEYKAFFENQIKNFMKDIHL